MSNFLLRAILFSSIFFFVSLIGPKVVISFNLFRISNERSDKTRHLQRNFFILLLSHHSHFASSESINWLTNVFHHVLLIVLFLTVFFTFNYFFIIVNVCIQNMLHSTFRYAALFLLKNKKINKKLKWWLYQSERVIKI